MVSTRRSSRRQETPSSASVSTPTTNISPIFSAKTSVATSITSDEENEEVKANVSVKNTTVSGARRSTRWKRARQESSDAEVASGPVRKRAAKIENRAYVELTTKKVEKAVCLVYFILFEPTLIDK